MNLQEIRAKYPDYADLSDEDLARGLHSKLYPDMPYDEFAGKIGLKKAEAPKKPAAIPTKSPLRQFLDVPPSIYDRGTGEWFPPEAIAADPLVRFAVGAARPLLGGAQMIRKALGDDESARFIGESLRRTEELGRQGMGGGYNIAGLAGEALSPAGLAAGKTIGLATTAPRRIAASALTGGVYGGLQPVTEDYDSFGQQKAVQTGLGAATGGIIGGAFNAAGWIGRSAKEMFTTLFGKNRGEILAKEYVNEIVGPQNVQKLTQVVQAELGKQPIPGYRPMTSQIVGSRAPAEASPWLGIAKSISTTGGGVKDSGFVPSVEIGRRLGEQNAAIERSMGGIAGTPAALKSAIGTRAGTAESNYRKAFADRLGVDSTLLNLADSPYFQRAYDATSAMRAEATRQGSPPTLVRDMHYVKRQLDEMLRQTGDKGLEPTERAMVGKVREGVSKWLEQSGPYKLARDEFKRQSIPINQMTVGQALENRLLSPTDQLTPGSFARAMQDEARTIKSATGQPRMALDEIFNPVQLRTLTNIGGLLDDRLAAARPLQPTMIGSRNVAESSTKDLLPSVLSRPVVISRWLINLATRGKGQLEKEIDQAITLWERDPQTFVAALREVPQTQRQAIIGAISKHSPQAAVALGSVGATGLLEP